MCAVCVCVCVCVCPQFKNFIKLLIGSHSSSFIQREHHCLWFSSFKILGMLFGSTSVLVPSPSSPQKKLPLRPPLLTESYARVKVVSVFRKTGIKRISSLHDFAPYYPSTRGRSVICGIASLSSTSYTGWSKKVSHYQMIKKLYQIALKPVNEIRFIHQNKVWIKYDNIIHWY